MMNGGQLNAVYTRNYQIMCRQTEGLTHEDSVRQLPFRGNCMNWVLGHIIVYRTFVLRLLGEEGVLSESELGKYERGTAPITECELAMPFEKLLEALDRAQVRIATALEAVTDDELAAVVGESEQTLGERITFFQWHETYHVGQLEILRQLAGKDDAIIE
jgi:uncharacterized damage-inducible protein DinB